MLAQAFSIAKRPDGPWRARSTSMNTANEATAAAVTELPGTRGSFITGCCRQGQCSHDLLWPVSDSHINYTACLTNSQSWVLADSALTAVRCCKLIPDDMACAANPASAMLMACQSAVKAVVCANVLQLLPAKLGQLIATVSGCMWDLLPVWLPLCAAAQI